MSKPKEVEFAVNILCASLVLGVVLHFSHYGLNTAALDAATRTLVIYTWGLLAFFIWKIGAGRNWARITVCALVVLGIPFCLSLLIAPLDHFIEVVQTVLQLFAVYLLFTPPSNAWFKGSAPPAVTEQASEDSN